MEYKRLIQDSIDMIENKLSDKLKIDDLTQNVFFSKYYYQRLFHAMVGDSIMEYIKKRRLSIAGRELCETSTSILGIALKYGYNSHESFTRAFKSYHGITPKECRKHTIYSYFDKFNNGRETPIMLQQSNILKVKEILSQNAISKVSENTNEILKLLNVYVVNANNLSQFTMSKANTIGKKATNLEVLARELSFLVERTKFTCDQIQSMNSNGIIESVSKILELIKALDDTVFQTNLISLNAGLQVAQTEKDIKTRYQLEEVAEKFGQLTNCITIENTQMVSLMNELIMLVSIDVQKESFIYLKKILKVIGLATDKIKSVYQFINEQALEADKFGKGFTIIVQEVEYIVCEITDLYVRVSNELKNLQEVNSPSVLTSALRECKSAIAWLSATAFRFNILAFSAELESARVPELKGLNDGEKQLLSLATYIHQNADTCDEYMNEVEKLISFVNRPEKPRNISALLKSLEDILYMGNVLTFYLKIELAKFKADIPIDTSEIIATASEYLLNLANDTQSIKNKFEHTLETRHDVTNEIQFTLSHELEIFSKDINKHAENLMNEAKKTGDMGRAFVFLSWEFKKYADRIQKTAEDFNRIYE